MKTNIPAFLNLLLCPKRVKHFKLTRTAVILSLLLEVPVSLAAGSLFEYYNPDPNWTDWTKPPKTIPDLSYTPEERIDRADSFNVLRTSAPYTVTGSVYISLKGPKTSEGQNVSVLYTSGGQAKFRVGGNVYLEYGSPVRTDEPYGSVTALYAEYGGTIYVDGDEAKVVVLSPEANAITTKDKGSEVILNAKKNVVVGGSYFMPDFSQDFLVSADSTLVKENGKYFVNVSLIEKNIPSIKNHILTNEGRISAVFSGDSSFWFGDEHSTENADIVLTTKIKPNLEVNLSKFVNPGVDVGGWEDGGDVDIGDWDDGGGDIGLFSVKRFSLAKAVSVDGDANPTDSSSGKNFDVTLENGAQWVYFGVSKTSEISKDVKLGNLYGSTHEFTYEGDKTVQLGQLGDADHPLGKIAVSFRSIPKRLSSVTLNKGGIVNLSDTDALNLSRSFVVANPKTEGGVTSLADAWPELLTVKHNYVRFGDLKSTTGGGGIFRLDINGDRTRSDMVFVEGSSTGGKHFIEIASFEDGKKELRSVKKSENLNSLADDQKIRFATVAKDSNISFSGFDPVSKTEAPTVNYTLQNSSYVTYYGNELHDITFYIGSEDYTPNELRTPNMKTEYEMT